MKLEDIKVGDPVIYIPGHLLAGEKSEMIKDENKGIVTSIGDTYVFVKYTDHTGGQATRPKDLYSPKQLNFLKIWNQLLK